MSELPLALGVIFFFLAVVFGVVWILKGFLEQRSGLSPVKADTSENEKTDRLAA